MNYLCSHGNFNFLHGIEHQASQFMVQYIEFYDLLKGYWNDEGMIRLCVILEWIDTSVLLYIMGFSASEIKKENPVKSENLPGCAVQVGSVAGIIAHNVKQ